MLALVWLACAGGDDRVRLEPPPSSVQTGDTGLGTWVGPVEILVRLDGEPVVATVRVGGVPRPWTTDADGRVTLALSSDDAVVASHPDARTEGAEVRGPEVVIDLETVDPRDNPAYVFQDPGNPDDAGNTSKCAHCHVTITADWYASPHARSASNPAVHDVYAGTAHLSDAASCAEAGGTWATGTGPGTGAPAQRCFLGTGVLPDTGGTGACADCHAPGIDGALGGRDLLEATGLAYDYGVHCDVCHKVAEVDLSAAPGVAGALRIHRPSEPSTSPGLPWRPLTYGPYGDVPNLRMGSVFRHLFHEAELCGGCHELWQAPLVPGDAVDPARWPDGRIPVHTTYSEWLAGPISPTATCQSCHMPPAPDVGNSADLGNVVDIEPGIAGGWPRPPGAVRRHAWPGPRQPDLGLLGLAGAIDLEERVADGVLTVEATVTNAGAGHALPTGEPLRAVLLLVEARCDGVALEPTGGDVLPDWAGALDVRPVGTTWPGAQPGDRIRVVRRPGGFVDYTGFGPFGDGTFDAAEKGLPVERWAGEAAVVAVSGDEVVLDRPLPAGDVAYRVPAAALPSDGDPALPLAGAPGAAFARVLVDAEGRAMVPHHRAVDVRSDNRLMPQISSTSTHTFAATCADPDVSAVLVHRAYPWALAAERRWMLTDSVIAEAQR